MGNNETTEQLRTRASNLRRAANAIDELSEYIMPMLECGPRELVKVATDGAFSTIGDTAIYIESMADEIENGNGPIELSLSEGIALSKALNITTDELADAVVKANEELASAETSA